MGPDAYIDALERCGEELAEAAEGGLDAPVPSCPGWDVAELVWHTGDVHRFWERIVSLRARDRGGIPEAERPDPLELLPWYRDGLERLVRTLRAADPAAEVWTWAPPHNAGFVQRRMAQETAVHAWDAQAAAGSPHPIETALASDGVDEFLDVFLPSDPERLSIGAERVHLHATDGGGEWTVTVREGSLDVDRSHGKGDAAVRASSSDLLLLLWRRRGPEGLEVFGDRAVLERFLARADLD
ncbi:MAG TPA: maleylpyruvate isomerase family mycothiol-dependent enzyme [Actinomycetota bacterium]|nr:maleylpyruvate isomerase family mycothiol-dependent enzyme [Actinomycetota bacterium]